MSDVELDYDFLTQRALKQVVRDVLEMTADLGEAPGNHHFFIEFLTKADGVSIPDHLHDTYPERMTIVLQHQFGDLQVDQAGFKVSLWFKGVEARLEIPFEAVTSFADPSVQFGLRFDAGLDPQTTDGQSESQPTDSKIDKENSGESDSQTDPSADVVELDAFRKK